MAEDYGFDEVYAASYARLVGELFSVTGDRAEAEDVVQEAFLRALSRWQRVVSMDHPVAWVRRVALNLAVSGWRRRVRGAAAVLRLRAAATSADPGTDMGLAPALAALSREQRAVILLHHHLGLSVAEIAATLGVAEGTVKSRLSRARTRLAELLGDSEEEVAVDG